MKLGFSQNSNFRKQQTKIIFLLFFTLCAIALLALGVGARKISLFELWNSLFFDGLENETFLFLKNIRLPRIIAAVFIGLGMGYSGVLIQTLFRNPITDASIVGVNSGASLFVAFFLVLGNFLKIESNHYTLSVAAFCGSLISIVFIYSLTTNKGITSPFILILAGLAFGTLARALLGFLVYIANDQQLRNITFWNLGSLSGILSEFIPIIVFVNVVLLFFYPFLFKALNVLNLGEREAYYLGVPIEKVKRSIIVLVSLSTGGSIAFTGMIDFIGMIAPHIARNLVGSDHKYLLPAASLIGGIVLLTADTLARTIVAPAELPIGILTSLLGAPILIYLVLKNKKVVSL